MEHKSLLPKVWDVPQVFRARLGAKVGRQRLMAADGHLLLVLHAPPQPDDHSREGRFIWRSPEGQWKSTDAGNGAMALLRHLDEYAEAIQRLDEMEEQAGSADDYFTVLERLAPTQRSTRHLHEVLQQAREACRDDRDIINARDRAYEIERTADLLYSETKNALDFEMLKQAEAQSQTSHRMAVSAHRLNLLAAFFFPLATLSGIFGVSFIHGFEAWHPPLPFLTLIGIGVLTGVLLTAFITRR